MKKGSQCSVFVLQHPSTATVIFLCVKFAAALDPHLVGAAAAHLAPALVRERVKYCWIPNTPTRLSVWLEDWKQGRHRVDVISTEK